VKFLALFGFEEDS